MRVLGVIAARGGSKGIPRKNLVPVLRKPLLYYTVAAAQASNKLARIILSTDDHDIAALGRQLGLDVPFLRPTELASDDATSVDVVYHAVKFVEGQEPKVYGSICLLQPTAPLRTAADIDSALELLENSDADSVVSVTKIDEPHPAKTMTIENKLLVPFLPNLWSETLRRQELEPVYSLNGAVYCVRTNVLLRDKSLWGNRTLPYIMPAERSVNINAQLDLMVAELLLKQRGHI